MTYAMYIDDVRDPPLALQEKHQFVVVRSCAEATAYITAHGFPNYVSFDHDLGIILSPDQAGAFDFDAAGNIMCHGDGPLIKKAHEDLDSPSGYDFCKWLCAQDQMNPWMKRLDFKYNVHSANPVGAAAIRQYLSWYLDRFVHGFK